MRANRHRDSDTTGMKNPIDPPGPAVPARRMPKPRTAPREVQPDRRLAILPARGLADTTPESDALQREFFDPMAKAFIDALHAACPGSSRARVAWCYQFAIGAMLNQLLSGERVARLGNGDRHGSDVASK